MPAPNVEFDALIADSELIKGFRWLWNESPSDGEAAAWIVKISQPTTRYILVDMKKSAPKEKRVRLQRHQAAVAQVHTHPRSVSPKPSTGPLGEDHDWTAATKLNIPIYVVSVFEIWKILPGGSLPTCVKVAQDWH